MDTIKLYLRSMKMLMRCQMEYPCSFLLNTLSQIIMQGGELFAVMLLIDRFHQIGQWQGKHILFFFGMMTITFYLVECFGRGIANFSPIVQSGALDTMLVKTAETSGLGANAGKADWRAQFVGLTNAAVTKDGGTIDSITGATSTSRAVANGVNSAVAAAASMG